MRTLAWTAAGVVCTLIGLLGVIVPIFPGIIFMMLAAFCFIQAGRTRSTVRPGTDPFARGTSHGIGRRGRRVLARLEDRLDRAAAPALNAADRIQLNFWLLCRQLLRFQLRPGASATQNADPNAASLRNPAADARTAHRTRKGARRSAVRRTGVRSHRAADAR